MPFNNTEEHYLDNSATTKPCPEAVRAVIDAMESRYGNPSSLHAKGTEASELLTLARKQIASAIGAERDEVYFTSGGTESNNLAILGAAGAMRRRGGRIVTTAIEHPSVYDAAKKLEAEGFEVFFVKPDKYGRIDINGIIAAATPETFLVSVMLVNNELGTIQAVSELKPAIKRAGISASVHCDAVQAFGKLPVNVRRLGVDLLTVSSHKIHGPKGAGALYIKSGAKLIPRVFGGLQESPYRPGTENLPSIAGFGAAAAAIDFKDGVAELNAYLRDRLNDIEGASVNSPDDALPHILNISVSGMRSEVILNYLSSHGIYVSSGSACSKGKRSRVLSECEITPANIDSAIRISFSKYNTRADIDALIDALRERPKRT